MRLEVQSALVKKCKDSCSLKGLRMHIASMVNIYTTTATAATATAAAVVVATATATATDILLILILLLLLLLKLLLILITQYNNYILFGVLCTKALTHNVR